MRSRREPRFFLTRSGALLALLVLGGCSSDYWVRFQFFTDAPPDVVVESDRIEIPAGIAVAVRAIPMRDEDELQAEVSVDLVSRRTSMLGVDRGIEERKFVLYGVEPGSTWIDGYFDEDFITEIPATVTPP